MARSKTDHKHKVFPLELTIDEHSTLKRRAKAAGLSMHAYAVSVLTNGKINKKS